jgi:hypothetical protein
MSTRQLFVRTMTVLYGVLLVACAYVAWWGLR